MDEQKNKQNLNQAIPDYSAEINAMYDAQRQQQLQSLESAYNQNNQALQNSLANNAKLYNEKANDLSAQYERTRMNNNMRAASNGISTGAASQMDLAQQANYLNAFGGIRSAQADSEAAINQQIANLELTYKNAVSDAIANNDHERAAALLSEYKRRDEAAKEEQRYQEQMRRQAEQDAFSRQQYADSQALNKAQLLAQYGDFSGYADLYGKDVANAMQQYFNLYSGGAGGTGSSGSRGGRSGNSYYPGGDSPNGPGVFDLNEEPETPEQKPNSGSELPKRDFNMQLSIYLDAYGNEEKALYHMSRDMERTARSQAELEAAAQGLNPGGQGYLRYVAQRTTELLNTNTDYLTAGSAYNKIRADQAAKDEVRKNDERRKSYAPYNQSLDEFMREAAGMPDNHSDLPSLAGIKSRLNKGPIYDVEVVNTEKGTSRTTKVDTTPKSKQQIQEEKEKARQKAQERGKRNAKFEQP